jgi:hypothetical protein
MSTNVGSIQGPIGVAIEIYPKTVVEKTANTTVVITAKNIVIPHT